MPGGNRGRGYRPRGKGPYRGRGRGRGGLEGTGRGVYHTLKEMDEVYLIASSNQLKDGTSTPGRGRGSRSNSGANTPRGRGKFNNPSFSTDGACNSFGSPVGRGRGGPGDKPPTRRGGIGDSPRGRGRGRGSKLRPDAPLSALLFQERPFLRPIKFVPSVYTKVLFQEEEEIFQAVVEEVGEEEQSHVPTADRVLRVFSGGTIPRMSSPGGESDADELVEIDFNDMGKLADIPARQLKSDVDAVEERFLGIRLGAQSTAGKLGKVVEADTISSMSPSKVVNNDGNDVFLAEEPITVPPIAHNHINAQGPVPLVQSHHAPQEVSVTLERDDPSLPQNMMHETGGVAPTESAEILIDNQISHVSVPMLAAPQALQVIEDKVIIDGDPQVNLSVSTSHPASSEAFENFYIDTQPSQVADPHRGRPRLLVDDDEEVIVYVAPHPGRVSPPPTSSAEALSLPSTSILTGTTALAPTPQSRIDPAHTTLASNTPCTSIHPQCPPASPLPAFESVSFSFTPTPKKARVFSKRSKAKAKIHQRRQEAHATRRQLEQQALFWSFGAMREEAMLRGGSARELDPQWNERRRGDSDVEWGDEVGEEEKADKTAGLAEGMDLDPELEVDEEAMMSFVKSMGPEGSRFMTMDDIADGEVMRLEDEAESSEEEEEEEDDDDDDDDEASEDEDEVDAITKDEEMLIAEPGDVGLEDYEETDEDDSDDHENSPRANFRARLERLRNHSKEKGKKPAASRKEIDEDSEEDDDYYDRADEDEDFIERIQMMIEENDDIIKGRDRKGRNQVFRAVRDGSFGDPDDLDYFDFKPARKNKDKYKGFPPELQDQWQKDHEKKAENKRLRQLKRLELAADPMSSKKGGKKGQKAMLAAAKLDPTITVLPNRIIDMTTLVQQIRRFVGDIGGPSSMSLPPTSKETRKQIHEMALAFNLKSISKGKGDSRYTTLTKTTRTGLFVDEGKVSKIVRRSVRGGGGGGEFSGSKTRGARGGGYAMPVHKEGDEVGKAAPKIGESNIGFKMLSLMGWSEGQGIGKSGGLDVPLTAVIKRSKLGLGASK
ncbi:hypothetical protein C0992_003278 [Termitomyces sp. T32_za158]|nr:hypothetical protein C0992_003278 [Termitomyces sp. T32_za158]